MSDSGRWPEDFFESNLSADDQTLLIEASTELEEAVLRNRRNRGVPLF